MRVDRSVPQDPELEILRNRCWQQRQEIQTLQDTMSVFRTGASALAVENDELRNEIARLRARAHDRSAVHGVESTEAELALVPESPAVARALLAEFLADAVEPDLLLHAQLVASELTTNSVRHSGGTGRETLVFRAERSPTSVRVETEDPGRGGPIAVREPGLGGEGGFGLHIVQVLSERWGAERVAAGGSRVWAELAIPGAGAPPPFA